MKNYTYPLSPAGSNEHLTRPSAKFKSQVLQVIASLVVFTIVYIALLSFAGVFAIVCTLGAYALLTARASLWSIIFSAAIFALGWMVFYFLVKFLFAVKKEREDLTEVTEEEHPVLFSFLKNVSEETNTRFPKHIYITPEVNAFVSYDSSFLSMFFQDRKNLTIGLGVVNMLNISEFKAVIAHEFGHFSQKSMKAGSFVYQSNKMIYNMLFENKSYAEIIDRWASIHSIFAIGARITIFIVQMIQYLLQQVYRIVNKAYMALSREMEFNADAMAAKVAGGNNIISALRRVEMASICYDGVITEYNEQLEEGYVGTNVFSQQRIYARFVAEENGFDMADGLPVLDKLQDYEVNYRKVVIADQWSSHPTRQQREEFVLNLDVNCEAVNESAWILFNNAEQLQRSVTETLYNGVVLKKPKQTLDDDIFEQKFAQSLTDNSFPEVYKGFYNNRLVSAFEIEGNDKGALIGNIEQFYTDNLENRKRLAATNDDIQTLEYIQQKKSGIKTFDYNGIKYQRKYADVIIEELRRDSEELTRQLASADRQVYRHYLHIAIQAGNVVQHREYYSSYFAFIKLVDENVVLYNSIIEVLQPVYSGDKINIDVARDINSKLIAMRDTFIERISLFNKELESINQFKDLVLSTEIISKINRKQAYFVNDHFHNENLDALINALNSFLETGSRLQHRAQKTLLEKQLQAPSYA